MTKLPSEIVSLIAMFSDPYVSLVLGEKPDRIKLFYEGGPNVLITNVIEKGSDINLLMKMKRWYFPNDAEVPIYKCVEMMDEDALKKVFHLWNSRNSDRAVHLAREKEFVFGMRYIGDDLVNIRYMNFYYVRKKQIEKVNLDVETPLMCIGRDQELLEICWQNMNLRHHLSSEQKAVYLGRKGVISDELPDVNIHYLACCGHIEVAKTIYVKERDTEDIDYTVPALLGIWDDTPYPEFCKAVYTKNYIKVNSILENEDQETVENMLNLCYGSTEWANDYIFSYGDVSMNEDGTWTEPNFEGFGWGGNRIVEEFSIQDILSGKVKHAELITSENKETLAITQHMLRNKNAWSIKKGSKTSITWRSNTNDCVLEISGNKYNDIDVAIQSFVGDNIPWFSYFFQYVDASDRF